MTPKQISKIRSKKGLIETKKHEKHGLKTLPIRTYVECHRAKLVGNAIEVAGRKVCLVVDGNGCIVDNDCRFVLDLATMMWSQE